jgi:hypothetical protein
MTAPSAVGVWGSSGRCRRACGLASGKGNSRAAVRARIVIQQQRGKLEARDPISPLSHRDRVRGCGPLASCGAYKKPPIDFLRSTGHRSEIREPGPWDQARGWRTIAEKIPFELENSLPTTRIERAAKNVDGTRFGPRNDAADRIDSPTTEEVKARITPPIRRCDRSRDFWHPCCELPDRSEGDGSRGVARPTKRIEAPLRSLFAHRRSVNLPCWNCKRCGNTASYRP